MSTPQSKTRTNYFKVTDREAFNKLVESLVTDDSEGVFPIENSRGEMGFCGNCSVYGLDTKKNSTPSNRDYEAMEAKMTKQIQKLLAPGHACIMTDITWDDLREMNGIALIITKNDSKVLDLRDLAVSMAREMLGNPKYRPDMIY